MRWIFLWILLGACRDGAAPTPAPAPDRVAPPHAGSQTITPRPTLAVEEPETTEPVPEIPIEKAFEAEAVDRSWKATTEAEIRRRVPGANAIECHATSCKVTFVGTQRELQKTVDELATERSLRGIAESIVLGAPEKRDDGTIAMHAIARFARP